MLAGNASHALTRSSGRLPRFSYGAPPIRTGNDRGRRPRGASVRGPPRRRGARARAPPLRLHGRDRLRQAVGGASDFLDDTWSADFNVFLEKGRFRGGIGIEFHRFRTLGARSLRGGLRGPLLPLRDVLPVAEGAGPPLPAGAARADAPARPGDPRPLGPGRDAGGATASRPGSRSTSTGPWRSTCRFRTWGSRTDALSLADGARARLPERVHGTRRADLEGVRARRVGRGYAARPVGRPPQPRPRHRAAAGRRRHRLLPERVLPRLRLRPGEPAHVVAEPRARLRVRPEQVRHQQLLPPVERRALLQHRPLDRPRVLGLVVPGGRRQLPVGVLRRDAEDVRERRDLDVARAASPWGR